MCSFYAAGCCNREECPYLHVFHGKNAKYCEDFAKGFCKLGTKCDKAHLTLCPDYLKNKTCSRGSKCPLMHRNSLKIRHDQTILVKERNEEQNDENLFISFKDNVSTDECKIIY